MSRMSTRPGQGVDGFPDHADMGPHFGFGRGVVVPSMATRMRS